MVVCARLFFLDLLSTMAAILSWLGLNLFRTWSSPPVSTTTPPSGPTRPSIPVSSPDMSSIACEEFAIDAETGFLPREEPVRRLPQDFDIWERALQQAHAGLTYTSDDARCTELEKVFSERWRQSIREASLGPFINP
jgi:hypothetical protein